MSEHFSDVSSGCCSIPVMVFQVDLLGLSLKLTDVQTSIKTDRRADRLTDVCLVFGSAVFGRTILCVFL